MIKVLSRTLLFFLLALSSGAALAAKKAEPSVSTEHYFEDQRVRGRYMYSDEAIARVEDEKQLDRLLGVRMNFKDRMIKESKRR